MVTECHLTPRGEPGCWRRTNLRERYITEQIYPSVLGVRGVLSNAPFIASIDLRNIEFDPVRMAAH
jgi:hypothetical protein